MNDMDESHFCPDSVGKSNVPIQRLKLIKSRGRAVKVTNSAHDMGVVSEGEREIARRNWWCNFRPATAQINQARGTLDVQNLPSVKLVLAPLR